jgi:transcription antitermination factor NusG
VSHKLDENPPVSFPLDVLETKQNGTVWWVAHTKSRREKALALVLAKGGIGYFLPLMKKRYRSNGRNRLSVVPLFSGYLFFRGSRMDRYETLKTGHIANILEVLDQETLITELKQIQTAIHLDAPLQSFPFVRKGRKVEIIDGPFAGLTGIVQREKKVGRLILSVDIIQQAVALEIDTDWVEPIS